jgi:hypothetical protein
VGREGIQVNADIFAEWFRRQGYKVIRTPSSYWYEAGSRVYQAFPYDWVIEPDEEELRNLLLKNNAIALRYSAPLRAKEGKISYHVVCENKGYDLGCLCRQTRQNVKRGLQSVSIEPIPISRLATEAWDLRQDTLERQGRTGAETREWWQRLCLSAEDLPGFEAWGAISEGKLVASFLAFKCDHCYHLLHEQSSTAHLESRSNNAIFYYVMHEAFKRHDISVAFFCLQSLDAPASVDQFKFRMGCTAKPVRQRIVFHPCFRPLVNSLAHRLVSRLLRQNQGNRVLAKAEGMFRFYLQGKRPLEEQDLPDCLSDCRDRLFEVPNLSHKNVRMPANEA